MHKTRTKTLNNMPVHPSMYTIMYVFFVVLGVLSVVFFVKEYRSNEKYYKENSLFLKKGKTVTFDYQGKSHTQASERLISLFDHARKNHNQIITETQLTRSFVPGRQVVTPEDFNKIVSFDTETMTVLVEGGMSIADLNRYLNRYGYVFPLRYASTNETISDLLNHAAQGVMFRTMTLTESVRSFRLLTPGGEVRSVSRAEDPDLFRAVLGGQGLFGIIIDAELSVTKNTRLTKQEHVISYKDFPRYFFSSLYADQSVVAMTASLYEEGGMISKTMHITSWSTKDDVAAPVETKYQAFARDVTSKFPQVLSRVIPDVLQISQQEEIFTLQGVGDAMTKTTKHGLQLSEEVSDIRESTYYVPTRSFVTFMNMLYRYNEEGSLKIHSIAVAFAQKNPELYLAPEAKEDVFSITVKYGYDNSTTEKEGELLATYHAITKELIRLGGAEDMNNPYHPEKLELYKEYPGLLTFLKKKNYYDPSGLIVNDWYTTYR